MTEYPSRKKRINIANLISCARVGIALSQVASEVNVSIYHVSAAIQGKPVPIAVLMKLEKWAKSKGSCVLPHQILRDFEEWQNDISLDIVSKRVLRSLLISYVDGNKSRLFDKFKSLESGENFELCQIFRESLIHVGINDEYLKWRQSAITAAG